MNNFTSGRKFKFETEFEKKSRKQTAFEFGPNFLAVQTYLEKSYKLPKILVCLDLPKCEFRLA
jgi:hypothetical protein